MIIRGYRLTRCGFYKRGESTPQFGSLSEFYPGFAQWVQGRPNVRGTNTYDEAGLNPPRVYHTAGFQNREGIGITLWNELPINRGGVGYITEESQVGHVDAGLQEIPDDTIPGWPSYYWCLPDQGYVFSLMPENMRGFSSSGMAQFRRYFHSYLRWLSPYVVRTTEHGDTTAEIEVTGYRRAVTDAIDPDLFLKVITDPLYFSGPLEEIRSNCRRIRKLVTKRQIDRRVPDQGSWLDGVLELFSFGETTQSEDDKIHFSMEVDWSPDAEDLERKIDYWIDQDGHAEVGVKYSNDQRTHWFNRALGKAEVPLDEAFLNNVLWNQGVLADVIGLSRNAIQNLIRNARQ